MGGNFFVNCRFFELWQYLHTDKMPLILSTKKIRPMTPEDIHLPWGQKSSCFINTFCLRLIDICQITGGIIWSMTGGIFMPTVPMHYYLA